MGKWEDTVMKREQVDAYFYGGEWDVEGITIEQAEISFKMGVEEESTQAYHAGLHDGILRGRENEKAKVRAIYRSCGNPKEVEDRIREYLDTTTSDMV